MTTSRLLKLSSVLWIIWGVFHLALGAAFVVLLGQGHPQGAFEAIPGVIDLEMFGMTSPFAIVATLKQHMFNLAWMGAVVTLGSVYVWKQDVRAIFLCALVGGFADLGYFLFVDLAGYADPPGPQMTYICAAAIATSLYAYFKADGLRAASVA